VIDAERAVLGALLAGYRDIDDVTAKITGACFGQPVHEWVFDAILRVHAAGRQPDPIQVRFALGDQQNRLPGGPLYLTDLIAACPQPASAPWYAEQVAQQAARRRVQTLAERLHQLAATDRDPFEVVNDAKQWLDAFTTGTDQDSQPIADAMTEVVDVAQHGQRRGIPGPWPDIDRITRGYYRGRLYVVGARPGVGKSLWASNTAVHIAKQDLGVFVASMEMSALEFTQRCAAAEAGVDIGRLEQGNLVEFEWNKLAPAVTAINQLPIQIADGESQTLAQIRAGARRFARQHPLGAVVVDYLQMVQPASRKEQREQQVAEMSRGFKRLSRELDVPVIGLAQVSRGASSRRDGRPTMNDLRESGAIEADADVVLLLHRDDDAPEIIEVNIPKNRSGPTGQATIQIQGHYSRLVGNEWRPYGDHLPQPGVQ
jgi:replicative DNA helicase